MSATNKTPNYDLPIFVGSDIPSWLVDFNNAMTVIDTSIKTASETGGVTKQYVDSAIGTLRTSVDNNTTDIDNNTNDILALQNRVTALENAISNMLKVGAEKAGITATQYDNLTIYASNNTQEV